jgi:hypothetical protein
MFFNEPPKPEEVLQALVQQPAKILSAVLGGGMEVSRLANPHAILKLRPVASISISMTCL